MGKTKEQILTEQKTQEEIIQMPQRMRIDKITSLQSLIGTTIPAENTFGMDTQWESVWSDEELETIKNKILIIVRDL